MDEQKNRMPPEGWLNSVIGITIELVDEEKKKIVYPFKLDEVECVYTLAYLYDGSGGDSIWFRLKNGTIYDIMGNRLSHHKGSFKRPVKGFEAIRTAEYVMDRLNGRDPIPWDSESRSEEPL